MKEEASGIKVKNYRARWFTKLCIDLNNLTRDWRIDITSCFDTFHGSKAATLWNWATRFWQFHKYYFSKMVLWKIEFEAPYLNFKKSIELFN